MDWGTAAVNGMEERDRVDASTNLCSRLVAVTGRRHLCPRPVDFFLLFSYSTVAVTGRRYLRPRPVDFVLLFSYSTVAVTGRRHLRPRPVDFVISFFPNLWLSLVGGNSTIARLILLYLAELLCDYFMLMYILWTNVCCCLMVENKID